MWFVARTAQSKASHTAKRSAWHPCAQANGEARQWKARHAHGRRTDGHTHTVALVQRGERLISAINFTVPSHREKKPRSARSHERNQKSYIASTNNNL